MNAPHPNLGLTRSGGGEVLSAYVRHDTASLAACQGLRYFPRALVVAVICLCFSRATPCVWFGSVGAARAPADVQELIRVVARNQLSSMRNPAHHYQYVHQDITNGQEQTTLEIETSQGMVARIIQVNGKPPGEKQCRRNLGRLARIVSSPRLQRSRLEEQQEDLGRREQLFLALPQAFIFQYNGTEKDTGLIRVKYRPNPAFHPHNRVGGILMGLAGTMWIDPSSEHLVKIEGRVIKSVSFGWGILAKLYPGGYYLMEQEKLPNGDWRTATLEVSLRGVILVVKKLDVKMREVYSSFQEVSATLTLPEAVEMLDRVSVPCLK